MDVSDASNYIQENNENKGSRMGHTKKIFKKKHIFIFFSIDINSLKIIIYGCDLNDQYFD
jgi:hypothetical protein